MRILVLANTPAHVHLYRHAVDRLERAGHDVLVLTREYACTTDLLDYFDMPYRVYGDHETEGYSRVGFARELGGQFLTIGTEAVRFDPDVVFGRGPYAAFAGTVSRTPVVLVLDDEPGDFNHTVSRPFADCIISPAVTRRDLATSTIPSTASRSVRISTPTFSRRTTTFANISTSTRTNRTSSSGSTLSTRSTTPISRGSVPSSDGT